MTRPLTILCKYCGKQYDGRKGQVICSRPECKKKYQKDHNDKLPRRTERRVQYWQVGCAVLNTVEIKVKLQCEDIPEGTIVKRISDQQEFVIRRARKPRNGRQSLLIKPLEQPINREQL